MDTPAKMNFEDRRLFLAKFIAANDTVNEKDVFFWYESLKHYANMYDPTLDDMAAFMEFAKEYELKPMQILSTLIHDINGIWDDPEFFLPRTNGYAERLEEKESA